MKGGAGDRRRGFSVTDFTVKGRSVSPSARAVASASPSTLTSPRAARTPVSEKSRPVATGVPPEGDQVGPEALRRSDASNGAVEVPPGGRAELHPGPLALDDHAGGHRLDPAGREPGHDLLPEDGRDLVAVEAVEDAAGLLGVDQAPVEVAPVLHGPGDGRGGDLVEDHPLHRHLGREDLGEVPGDGLPFAVLVCGQVDLAGLLHEGLQPGHHVALLGGHHVEGLEAVVDVDAEPGPALALVGGRDLVGPPGQVPDVTHRRLDHEVWSEEAGDGPGLGRGLDDHEGTAAAVGGLGGSGGRRHRRGRE